MECAGARCKREQWKLRRQKEVVASRGVFEPSSSTRPRYRPYAANMRKHTRFLNLYAKCVSKKTSWERPFTLLLSALAGFRLDALLRTGMLSTLAPPVVFIHAKAEDCASTQCRLVSPQQHMASLAAHGISNSKLSGPSLFTPFIGNSMPWLLRRDLSNAL